MAGSVDTLEDVGDRAGIDLRIFGSPGAICRVHLVDRRGEDDINAMRFEFGQI